MCATRLSARSCGSLIFAGFPLRHDEHEGVGEQVARLCGEALFLHRVGPLLAGREEHVGIDALNDLIGQHVRPGGADFDLDARVSGESRGGVADGFIRARGDERGELSCHSPRTAAGLRTARDHLSYSRRTTPKAIAAVRKNLRYAILNVLLILMR